MTRTRPPHSPDPTPPARPPGLGTMPHPLPLEDIAACVSTALGDDEPGTLIRATGSDQIELGFKSLDGEHPVSFLMGFTAPPDWQAIGVHCTGRAHSLDPASVGHPPDRQAVVVTALVERSGRGAWLVRHASGSRPATCGGTIGDDDRGSGTDDDRGLVARFDDAPQGLIGDACRRTLGLSTPPAPASTAELWLRVWLDRVVESAAFTGNPDGHPAWDEVVAMHPAVGLWCDSTTRPPALGDPDALAECTLALADTWTWPQLRRDPEVLAFAGPPVTHDEAAWMDDGMYARFVLGGLAPLPVVARSMRQLFPPPVFDKVDQVVTATGLRWTDRAEVPVR